MDNNNIKATSLANKNLGQKTTEPEKKITKVGGAQIAQSRGQKFKSLFISNEAGNLKSYIFMDVLIPAAKKAISDIVINGIDMILYGQTGRSKDRSDKRPYNSYYDGGSARRTESRGDRPSANNVSRMNCDVVWTYDDHGANAHTKALEALDALRDSMNRYHLVTMSEYCSITGVDYEYTYENYGWTSINSAQVVSCYNGWKLVMPKPMPID